MDEKPGSDNECCGRVKLGAGGGGVTWLLKKVLVSVREGGWSLGINQGIESLPRGVGGEACGLGFQHEMVQRMCGL